VKTNTLTQLSSEVQHLTNRLLKQLPDALPSFLQKRYKRLMNRAIAAKGWIGGGVGLLLLWVWAWQWVLSIAIGLAVIVGVYLGQQRQLKLSWRGWHKLWSRSNRSATVAVLAGILAWGSTYLATAVWLETDRPWLATSVLLEGGGILAILALLLWQLLQQPDRSEAQFQALLADLSDADPLKRLIAVRQLTQSLLGRIANHSALPISPLHLAEYFRLMLDRETEPLVCRALVDSLQALQPSRQLAATQLATVSPSASSSAWAQPMAKISVEQPADPEMGQSSH
jgi:hypothetical protein